MALFAPLNFFTDLRQVRCGRYHSRHIIQNGFGMFPAPYVSCFNSSMSGCDGFYETLIQSQGEAVESVVKVLKGRPSKIFYVVADQCVDLSREALLHPINPNFSRK